MFLKYIFYYRRRFHLNNLLLCNIKLFKMYLVIICVENYHQYVSFERFL